MEMSFGKRPNSLLVQIFYVPDIEYKDSILFHFAITEADESNFCKDFISA